MTRKQKQINFIFGQLFYDCLFQLLTFWLQISLIIKNYIFQMKQVQDDQKIYYEKNEKMNQKDQFEAPQDLQNIDNNQDSTQELTYEILPLSNIYDQFTNEHLYQIENIICKSTGWCLILLKQFNMDKNILKQSFYSNQQKYLKQINYSENLQDPNNFDRGKVAKCDICLNEDIPIYSNICDHSYCLKCWLMHIKNNIQSGSLFPRCMNQNCDRPLLMETIIGLLKLTGQQGIEWLNKYFQKISEMFIANNRNYQFCTGVDCNNCIKLNDPSKQTVKCVCGKIFCFKCHSDDHYPCKCDQKEKWEKQIGQINFNWICANTKICPSCRIAISRSDGCNFMTCICGQQFCYMCSGPWYPDHFDFFNCHLNKQISNDFILKKYFKMYINHCAERYLFNQIAAKNYKKNNVFIKRKYLFKQLMIQLQQTQFLEKAYKCAIECCQKLKWIYAFTYFHQIKHQFKVSFDCYLGEYEKYKQNLLKLLDSDLNIYMQKIQIQSKKGITQIVKQALIKQFTTLKTNIVNYYTQTSNYSQILLKELILITELMDKEIEDAEIKKYQQSNEGEFEPLIMETRQTKIRETRNQNFDNAKQKKWIIW